jgi:hypothetical protein
MPQISTEEFERAGGPPLTKYSSRDEHSFQSWVPHVCLVLANVGPSSKPRTSSSEDEGRAALLAKNREQ